MLFNSIEFLLFLPLIFILYWFVFNRSLRWQNGLVLVASYFFYAWWSWKFLALLIFSTLLDYAYGFMVASPDKRKARLFLWLSVLNNLGILAVFKYYNFFAQEFARLFQSIGWKSQPYFLDIALPIGISFYTFHGMSYVFDIYREKQTPVKNFVDYSMFVSFFPLLVAGPIERAGHLLPQVQKKRIFNYPQSVEGCRLILWGMFKKVVIADNLASIVDLVFKSPESYGAEGLVFAAVAFSFQIYGDFSGYSDIALGTAKLFGFELLSNFRFPYFSRDLAEFWRRWHISLSSWFRDYLYIPLGGSKGRKWKSVRNTFIVFLVSGFWHGASWNFLAWGGIHAMGFLPLLLTNRNRINAEEVVAADRSWPSIKELMQMLLTFSFVTFAWIFFRAASLRQAFRYIENLTEDIIFKSDQMMKSVDLNLAFYCLPLFLIVEWLLRFNERKLVFGQSKWTRMLSYIIILLFILIIGFGRDKSFIYFVF